LKRNSREEKTLKSEEITVPKFKEITVETFEPPSHKLQYKIRKTADGRFDLILNDAHPLFELSLTNKGKPDDKYIIECAVDALLETDLEGEGKILEKRDLKKIENLMRENPEHLVQTVEEVSRARQEFLFDIFEKQVERE